MSTIIFRDATQAVDRIAQLHDHPEVLADLKDRARRSAELYRPERFRQALGLS